MTHEAEGIMDARSAVNLAKIAVNQELGNLYCELRDRDAVIESQQKQIKMLSESVEKDCATHKRDIQLMEIRVQHSIKAAGFSTFCMCISFISTLVTVVYSMLG